MEEIILTIWRLAMGAIACVLILGVCVSFFI